MPQLVLGSETEVRGEKMLVVRLIHSQSLFDEEDGETTLIDEHYAELKRNDGTPEFISIDHTETKFTEKQSKIRGLDITWKPKW